MNYINRIYEELEDLHYGITVMRSEMSRINKEYNQIINEMPNTNFSASQGVEMYKKLQEFLQERRLTKSRLEEMEVQFEILGGVEQLRRLERAKVFSKVPKKSPKYHRRLSYFENFKQEVKEEVKEMYHIIK